MDGLKRNNSGNVIFIILIAIALFAALSFAITNSSSNSKGVEDEETLLAATTLIDYTNKVKKAVKRIMLVGGAAVNEVSFYEPNNYVAGLYWSARPNSDRVFFMEGGQVDWFEPEEGNAWVYTGNNFVVGLGSNSSGCTVSPYPCNDLMVIRQNISLATCQVINDRLDVLNSIFPPHLDSADYDTVAWKGNKTAGYKIILLDVMTGNHILGKSSACFESQTKTGYHFYNVLKIDIP